jgi:hypothetical protein
MIDGVYLGTDKLVHFAHMGHIYYTDLRRGLARGLSVEEAMSRVLHVGAGAHALSEQGMLGKLSTGVLSNADLASNFAGMRFYQNLTEPVRLRGVIHEPMLERDGPYWTVSDRVARSEFYSAFVSAHWNEAFNPGIYAFDVAFWMPDQIRGLCDDLLTWYADADGHRRTREEFLGLGRELMTYFGEEYGHHGAPEEMVSIATICFGPNRGSRPATETVEPPQNHGDAAPDDPLRRSELWHAAAAGDAEAVRALLDEGADPRAADIDGEAPLHQAVRWGRSQVAEALLARGADPNARDPYGVTPLHLAARSSEALVDLLLRHGAEPGVTDGFGCTPLHDAAAAGQARVVERLIDGGADVNAADVNGYTPLQGAQRAGASSVVSLLIARGAHRAAGRVAAEPRGHGTAPRSDTVHHGRGAPAQP